MWCVLEEWLTMLFVYFVVHFDYVYVYVFDSLFYS